MFCFTAIKLSPVGPAFRLRWVSGRGLKPAPTLQCAANLREIMFSFRLGRIQKIVAILILAIFSVPVWADPMADAATIEQVGDYNAVQVTQAGAGQNAKVRQSGSGNAVEVGQSATDVAGYSVGNRVDVGVAGDANVGSIVSQAGSGNGESTTVSGNQNGFSLVQQGGGNQSTQTVTGDYNTVSTNQNGLGNQSAIAVDGISNSVGQEQIGNSNTSSLTVEGSGNTITQHQFGSGLSYSITQIGNGRTVDVTQRN